MLITSLNCGYQRVYSSFPDDVWTWETMVKWCRQTKTSWFFHQSSLVILPAESSGSKQEEQEKGMINLAFLSISFHSCKWFLHADTGPRLYFPSEKSRAPYFYRPLKSIASAGFEPTNLGSNGKHVNHYTTEEIKPTQRYLFQQYFIAVVSKVVKHESLGITERRY
jgi:hypothetical protein